jgi:hypothetical protein
MLHDEFSSIGRTGFASDAAEFVLALVARHLSMRSAFFLEGYSWCTSNASSAVRPDIATCTT